MPINVPKAKVFPQVEAGSYIGRCYSVIHIGTTHFEYQGNQKQSNKVRLTFELPTELHEFKEGEGAKPYAVSVEYTLSLHEKSKLRPMLKGLRGKDLTEEEADSFDVASLVGQVAFLNIVHSEKGYAEIASISKVPKGMECPSQVNASVVLDYNNFNEAVFEKLPNFIKDKMRSSDEYKAMKGIKTGDEPLLDENGGEIPFLL